jgi:hypothetical protein
MIVNGNCVTVDYILFDVVRARCADLGLAVGDTLRVTGRTVLHIALRTARGTICMLEREFAHFIVVTDAPAACRRPGLRADNRSSRRPTVASRSATTNKLPAGAPTNPGRTLALVTS